MKRSEVSECQQNVPLNKTKNEATSGQKLGFKMSNKEVTE